MKRMYLIFLMGVLLSMTSCGKNAVEEEQSVSDTEKSDVNEKDMVPAYTPVEEDVVMNALDIFSTGVYMEDYHKHDDRSSCTIRFEYAPDYAMVEFKYYNNSADTGRQEYFLRLGMQNERILVLLYDSDKQKIVLEAEGMIDNVNPDNLKSMAETLMNYESVENVGSVNIDDNTYWVENVKYKDNKTVQVLVCTDEHVHSKVKYGDLYLPVVSFESSGKIVLDGSREGSLDEINSAIKNNIPEGVLNEWIQWLNN